MELLEITQQKLLRRVEWRSRFAGLLFLIPVGVLFLVVYAYPLLLMVLSSLFDPAFTVKHYRHLWLAPVYGRVMLLTFRVAATVTLVALVSGYPIAYLLATAPPRRTRLLLGLVLLPFWISVLVRNYAWMILLSRTGVLNQLLLGTRVITEPLNLMFNISGVIIGLTYILVPFMILALYGVMSGIDRQLLRAAASLGASPFESFCRIFLPLSLPGVAAGCLLVFIMGMGSFITPALLGGGRVPMIATLIESQMREVLNWGFGSAISTVLLAVTLVMFGFYTWLLGGKYLLGSGKKI